MSKTASPTLIGIFTLVGVLLAAGSLILFGASSFFEKTSRIVLYFDQSANGLLVGSDARFGGVRIGRVASIRVLVDSKENRKIIPVVVELSEKDLRYVGSTSGGAIDFATDEGVKAAVAAGMRARMKQQSLLTGQLYIEFDIVPDKPGFVYKPERRPPYPAVPTMGTELDAIISGISDGLKKFNDLDLGTVMKELTDVITTTKTQISALDLKAINDNILGITTDVRALTGNKKLGLAIDNLSDALKSFDELTKKANQGIDPLLKDLEKVMQQATAGLEKIKEASADISNVTNPRAPVLMRLQNVLEEAERASRAIKELANDLKRNPNTLLRGKDLNP
ncbi:MlaD family protein [Prosthecobacter sp.]|uniref:MlaD family protein n=1 Tax=Prosthecobacter sp. TaxID=1965333 RepID=UPI002488F628|nr:MlaD family protein [Prosthecobacter sp.]MDI1312071.1 MlaD family protein [Prosthecobacter sp.]